MVYVVSSRQLSVRIYILVLTFFLLLEQECCDGSDEALGVCPDRCKEIGEIHRKKVQAELKLRKTVLNKITLIMLRIILIVYQGSKIRATYIAFAQKEKKRLEESTSALEGEIAVAEKEVSRLKGTVPLRTVSIANSEFA